MATRKVKDAKDLSTNELIYFKGHAKATFMSDGRTVEDAVNNVSGGGGSTDLTGYATEEYVDGKLENIVDADGYLYSNGEKVDMRFTRSLLPVGTPIPAKANLNTIAYLKIGKYYCSLNVDAETVTNCPSSVAFSMEVFNPLGVNVDDETTREYTYRLRVLTKYDTGQQYIQYCKTSGTAGSWTYGTWYVSPRTSFALSSSKNGGSATKGASNRGVYIDSTGTFQQMSYTIAKSVPSNAVFTDTNTKVTAVGNHYTPTEDTNQALNAPEGEVVTGIKRDAAGHVVGVTSSPISGESNANRSILTCEFMGEVGDVIWSDDDQDRIDYIADWMEALSLGKVCVLDFDEYEGTYAMVHAINYRNDATYGIGKVYFSYIFEGYLYDVEYESVSLPVTLTIVNKTKVEGGGGSNAEPMVCAYRILSATANHIELDNYTYNGQTMYYREGAIISILNPNSADIVFEGGIITLDGNDYESNAFTLKGGATALFTLGVDSGILFPVSSVGESNSGGSSEGGSSAYAEVNHGTSDRTFELTPNTFHVWGEMTALTLTLGAETVGVANEYLFQFTSPATPTSLTLPDDIKFTDDLVIEANKIYQISILKGLGSVLSWDSVTLIENKATYNEGDFMNGGTLTFEYPTASEIKLYLDYYSSPYLTIPAGTTTIAIDWYEPSAPSPKYFEPSFDDTYTYIIV